MGSLSGMASGIFGIIVDVAVGSFVNGCRLKRGTAVSEKTTCSSGWYEETGLRIMWVLSAHDNAGASRNKRPP